MLDWCMANWLIYLSDYLIVLMIVQLVCWLNRVLHVYLMKGLLPDWLAPILIDWLSDCLVDWVIVWLINWLIDWFTDWSTWLLSLSGWCIDRSDYWRIDWHIEVLIHWLIDWFVIDWMVGWVIGWLNAWLTDWFNVLLINSVIGWLINILIGNMLD